MLNNKCVPNNKVSVCFSAVQLYVYIGPMLVGTSGRRSTGQHT